MPAIDWPKMITTAITKAFHRDIPKICLHTAPVRIFPLPFCPWSTLGRGGSVERAMAAKVSIIKLIQRRCTGLKGEPPSHNPPMAMVKMHDKFTVI